MDSSISLENQIWFLRVCHHVPFLLYYTKNWVSPSFIRVQSYFDMFRLSPGHRETFRIAPLPLFPMVYMTDFPEDGQAQAETFQVCGQLKRTI